MTDAKSDSEPKSGLLERLAPLLHWRGRTLALLVLSGFVALRVLVPVPVEGLQLALFDTLQGLKPRQWQPLPVAIVDIDEESLARHGQWPWPRHLMAELVDRIGASGPLAVGFDILFPEPDRLSPHLMLQDRPDIDPALRGALAALGSNDSRLAKSLASVPSVLGIGALRFTPEDNSHRSVAPVPVLEQGGSAQAHVPKFPAALQSLPELDRAAASRAVLNVIPETDGVVRRVPLVVAIGETLVPTLALEMLRLAIGAKHFAIHRDGDGLLGVSIDDILVPTARDGRVWVNFTVPRPDRFVSAAGVLAGDSDALARIQGKLVLLGSSGLGLVDEKTTPVAPRVNGIEIHAMLLESILAGELLVRPDFADSFEIGLLAATGLILIVLVPYLKPKWSALPLAGLFVLLAGAAWGAHDFLSMRIDTSFTAIADAAVFAVLLGAGLVETERLRRILQRELEEERAAAARLEGELSAARTIQLGILPSEFPAFPEHGEFDLHAMLEPAKAVGGDLYDFVMLDRHHLFFIVGDVSGKGIPASLFMALSKALYKSSALRRKAAIEEIMTEANAEISRENPAMMFVTALAGIMDIRTGEIEFCNAGHDPSVLLAPGQVPRVVDNDGGPPLCVLDDFDYPRDSHRLRPGEALVLYTDGVTEAVNAQDELYSLDRMFTVLEGLPDNAKCAEITKALYSDILAFADGAEAADDVTILVLRYHGETKG